MKKVIDAAQGTPEDHRYHGGLFHAPFARDILTRIYILEAIRWNRLARANLIYTI